MRIGRMLKAGSVILARVQFTDTFEVKTRPAVVLFEEHNNIIIAGITSNTQMQGIPLTKKEGAISDSVIKPNYIFTISKVMIVKELFTLTKDKKQILYSELTNRLSELKR
jgi:mRNA interferase MazF